MHLLFSACSEKGLIETIVLGVMARLIWTATFQYWVVEWWVIEVHDRAAICRLVMYVVRHLAYVTSLISLENKNAFKNIITVDKLVLTV